MNFPPRNCARGGRLRPLTRRHFFTGVLFRTQLSRLNFCHLISRAKCEPLQTSNPRQVGAEGGKRLGVPSGFLGRWNLEQLSSFVFNFISILSRSFLVSFLLRSCPLRVFFLWLSCSCSFLVVFLVLSCSNLVLFLLFFVLILFFFVISLLVSYYCFYWSFLPVILLFSRCFLDVARFLLFSWSYFALTLFFFGSFLF